MSEDNGGDLSAGELTFAEGNGGLAIAGPGRGGLATLGVRATGEFSGAAGVFRSAAIDEGARGAGGGGGGDTADVSPALLGRCALISVAISETSLAGFQAEKPSFQT